MYINKYLFKIKYFMSNKMYLCFIKIDRKYKIVFLFCLDEI